MGRPGDGVQGGDLLREPGTVLSSNGLGTSAPISMQEVITGWRVPTGREKTAGPVRREGSRCNPGFPTPIAGQVWARSWTLSRPEKIGLLNDTLKKPTPRSNRLRQGFGEARATGNLRLFTLRDRVSSYQVFF